MVELRLGCHRNRRTLPVEHRAGFTLQSATEERWRDAPPIVAPLILGEATA